MKGKLKKWMARGAMLPMTLALILVMIPQMSVYAGPAAGQEYELNGLDPSKATVKPTLTVSTVTFREDQIPEDRIVTVTLTVQGAAKQYAPTGLHIQFDSRLTLVPNDGKLATIGDAGSSLASEIQRDGDHGLFLATAGVTNSGKDGVLWSMDFRLPENAAADKYPIEICYKSTPTMEDIFTNVDKDEEGQLMQAYVFTQGCVHGCIEITALPHTHSISYSASGAVITAQCTGSSGTCTLSSGMTLTLSAPAQADLTYDGNAKAASLNNDYNKTAFPGTYEITYYRVDDNGSASQITASEVVATGKYKAQVSAGEGDGVVTAVVDFEITPKSISGATVTLNTDSLEFSGSQQSVSVTDVTLADGTVLTADDYEVSGNTGTDAGSYTVTVTGKGNYTGSATAGWSIGNTSMTVTAQDEKVTYDGNAHGISVEVTKPASGAEVKYGTEEGTYDLTESPSITDVKDSPLKVYFEVTADNYDTYTGSAIITIEPKSINGATVTLSADSLEYTDAEQSVSVTEIKLSDGTVLKEDDYTVSGNTGKDPGSYEVTVTGKGNYKDTAAAAWTIKEPETEEPTTEEPTTEEPTTEEPTTKEPTTEEPTTEEPTTEEPTEPPTEEPTEPETEPEAGGRYHLLGKRNMQGWVQDGYGWRFYGENGMVKDSWLLDNDNWYYMDSNGFRQTGWLLDNGYWYYLDPDSGIMQTGWVWDNGYWYYLYPLSGAMATGWVWDNDNWYYMYPLSGIMITGDCLIDGIWYSFADSGAWIG